MLRFIKNVLLLVTGQTRYHGAGSFRISGHEEEALLNRETSDVVKFVNELAIVMVGEHLDEKVIRHSDCRPFEFRLVSNRLKVMSELNPISCSAATRGNFQMVIQGDQIDFETEYYDEGAEPRVILTVTSRCKKPDLGSATNLDPPQSPAGQPAEDAKE